jgi:hypothetical protein
VTADEAALNKIIKNLLKNPPFKFSVILMYRPTAQRKTEKERQLADGRGRGDEGVRGAESSDRKKAWSSIKSYKSKKNLRRHGNGRRKA